MHMLGLKACIVQCRAELVLHSQPDLGNLESLDGNSETIQAIFEEMDSTEVHARRNAGLVHSKTFADKLAGLFNPPPEVWPSQTSSPV